MTAIPDPNAPLTISPLAPGKHDWPRAWRYLRALLADPDDTEKALDFFFASGRGTFESQFQRFAAGPLGRALLRERPSLAAALSDRAALERMGERSLGRAYRAYMDHNGFEVTGLIDLQARVEARWEREEDTPRLDPHRAYYRDRMLLCHDLFHVLTGYGTDDVGEATLLAFSLAQSGGPANWLLTVGAAVDAWRRLGPRWLAYDVRAWLRGRRARQLVDLPWEELLALRVELVRELVGIEPPDRAHPRGILAGRFREEPAV